MFWFCFHWNVYPSRLFTLSVTGLPTHMILDVPLEEMEKSPRSATSTRLLIILLLQAPTFICNEYNPARSADTIMADGLLLEAEKPSGPVHVYASAEADVLSVREAPEQRGEFVSITGSGGADP